MDTAELRESIAKSVRTKRDRLRAATPKALFAGLAAAAVAPVLVPLLAGAGIGGVAAALGNLGVAVGVNHLSLVASGTVDRLKRRGAASEEELRDHLEADLIAALEVDGPVAAGLRREAGELLRMVRGVEVALAAARDDIKDTMAQKFAVLAADFAEFRWIFEETRQTLNEIRSNQALALASQRAQLDLLRWQQSKLNEVLDRLAERPPPALQAQEGDGPVVAVRPAPGRPPYKGLVTFDAEDADLFFGRERLVADLTTRLDEGGFLAVVGPSGSGKSSLVRAGLVPRLLRDPPGGGEWRTTLFTPGAQPLEELAAQLAALRGVLPTEPLHELEMDHRALSAGIRQLLAGDRPDARVLIVVDQFEELFTLSHDETARHRFVEAVLHAARTMERRAVIIVVIRADFYGRCAAYPALAAALQQDQVLVGPMTEDELRRAIEGPAERVGVRLQPGLSDRIMRDVGDEPGGLPLLSHALFETWMRREGDTLTLAGYNESGGVRRAIAMTADSVFEERLTPDERAIARSIFLRLIEPGEGTEDTRRRARLTELLRSSADTASVVAVLQTLTDARLVTAGEDTVEVAHEALIREWPALRQWIDEDRVGLRIRLRLTEAAEEWVSLARDPGAIYRGARLLSATEWAAQHQDDLSTQEREFLEASRSFHESELDAVRRRNRRLRLLVAGLGLFLVVALIATGIAATQSRRARDEARVAAVRRLAAQALASHSKQLDLGLLLSLEAIRLGGDRPEGWSSLLTGLQTSPRVITSLGGHDSTVRVLAFSGSEMMASGDEDGRVLLWDMADRSSEVLSASAGSQVRGLSFVDEGQTVVAGMQDGSVLRWDLRGADPARVKPDLGGSSNVLSYAFCPQGYRLAAYEEDGSVLLWDLLSGDSSTPATLDPVAQAVRSAPIAFNGDCSMLAVWSMDGIVLLDTRTREQTGGPLPLPLATEARALSFRGTDLLACATDQGLVMAWSIQGDEGTERSPLIVHDAVMNSVQFSPSGDNFAATSNDGTVLFGQVGTGAGPNPVEIIRPEGFPVRTAAFSADGKVLAVGGFAGSLTLWDMVRPNPLVWSSSDEPVDAVAVAGARVVSGNPEGLTVWDPFEVAAEGSSLEVDRRNNQPVALARESDTVAFGVHNIVRLLDGLESTDRADLVGHEAPVRALAFAPPGEDLLASGDAGGEIRLWKLSRPGEVPTSPPARFTQPADEESEMEEVRALAFVSSTLLASGGRNHDVMLWSLSEEAEPVPLLGHVNSVNALAMEPNGTLLASGSDDRTVRLWDLDSGDSEELIGHTQGVLAVAFSPDGKLLASGDAEGEVLLWDVETREPFGPPLRHEGEDGVTSIAFLAPGPQLLVGGDFGLRVWDLERERWVEMACEIAGRNLMEGEWGHFLSGDPARTCENWPDPEPEA
jgi:WD40 repeat protein/energy-coupling factor transporter ATP-binding protein EcfA2